MGCSIVGPTNPISDLIASSLGANFSPPYDLNFQPVDRSKLTEEKFLKMNTPGGGKIKPIGDPKHKHITEYISPIAGVLGSVFALFAPLYIILDVIRALIDIICSLFNPVPLILTVVDLFLNVVPPLIALYPPLSAILHAINAAKLITAIVGGIVSSLIPIIANVVECGLSIETYLSEGNISAIDNIGVKICELLQDFANTIAGFGPIKFILDLLEMFLGLGAKFFCIGAPAGDSPCCTTENCPPMIINPPAGNGLILNTVKKFTLKDLATYLLDVFSPVLETVTDVMNRVVGIIEDLVEITLSSIIDAIVFLLDAVNGSLFGALDDFIEDLNLDSGSVGGLNIPDFTVPTAPDEWQDVVFVQPAMYLEYKTAFSQPNENGLVSQIGVGHEFSASELSEIQNFIIPPDAIPVPLPKLPSFLGGTSDSEAGQDPATIKVKITRPSGSLVERTVIAERKRFSYNTVGMDFDPIVVPGTTQTASGAAGSVEFKLPNGGSHPLFINEIPFVAGTLPQSFGNYMVDYENGAVVIFVGNNITPFTADQAITYDSSREVIMSYSYKDTANAQSVIASAVYEFPTLPQMLAGLGLPNTTASEQIVRDLFQLQGLGYIPLRSLGVIHVFDDTFETGDEVEYEILPVQTELLKNNLIGLGCQNDIQSAAQSLTSLINADIGSLPPGLNALDPLKEKIGQSFPPPPEQGLQELLDELTEDPTKPVDPIPLLNSYLEEVAEFADQVLCVGVSSVTSVFEASKPFVLANGKDFSTLSLRIKDQGGNDLLVGGLLPSSSFRAEFLTTLGDVGEVEFDPDTGSFYAPISSEIVGIADITARFIVRDKVCSTISEFSDLSVKDQIVRVEFVPERTIAPRTRRQPQYVQSRGGRVRR